jgi:hypothetical protein
MSEQLSEVAPAARVRGRPTYVSAAIAEELAFRTYIASFEPPKEHSAVMTMTPEEIAKLRRNALIYVSMVRRVARSMMDMGYIDRTTLAG